MPYIATGENQNSTTSMQKVKLALLLALLSYNSLCAQNSSINTDTTDFSKKTLYRAAALTGAYYASSMLVLGNTWYKDQERVSFHFLNDLKDNLQVDKLGHTFGAYVYSYIGFSYLTYRGMPRNEALIYGGSLGFVLQAPIEIMDGLYEGYGFSWSDMLANALGSGLVVGQELLWNEQKVKMKFSYWPSPYANKAQDYLGKGKMDRMLKDYNGQTYWLSFPAKSLAPSLNLPRWLNVAVGYGANGMYGKSFNPTSINGINIPPTTRYRQYLLSLDIDWTKIKTRSKALKVVLKGLTFVKLPFPTIEYSSKKELKLHWIYY